MHGITIHGPVWHYLFEVRHFHYMKDEHILEHSNLWAFCISVCSSSHAGAYHILRDHQTFKQTFHSHFDLVVDPCELHIGAYPRSLGSSDLAHASLSFNLVVDSYELSYWGISSLAEFACIIILVILWLWATWSDHHHVSLVWVKVTTLSIDHHVSSVWVNVHFWDRTYIDRSLVWSVWVQFEFFSVAPISIDHFLVSLGSVWVFRVAPISIGHSPCVRFEFLA